MLDLSHPLVAGILASLVLSLIGFGAWLVREQRSIQTELGDELAEVKVTLAEIKAILIGPDGQNGVRSDVKSLREARHAHGDKLHAHEGKLALHDEKHRRHDARIDALEDEHRRGAHGAPPIHAPYDRRRTDA